MSCRSSRNKSSSVAWRPRPKRWPVSARPKARPRRGASRRRGKRVHAKGSRERRGREGALISQNPLLIQKTMADKLSDKVQVIIAAPPAQGGFIGANLLG